MEKLKQLLQHKATPLVALAVLMVGGLLGVNAKFTYEEGQIKGRVENSGFKKTLVGSIITALLDDDIANVDLQGADLSNVGTLGVTTLTATDITADTAQFTTTTITAITSSTKLGLGDGTLLAPSLYFTSAPTIGLYKNGTRLGFSSGATFNGTATSTITGDGTTSTIGGALNVNGTSSVYSMYLGNDPNKVRGTHFHSASVTSSGTPQYRLFTSSVVPEGQSRKVTIELSGLEVGGSQAASGFTEEIEIKRAVGGNVAYVVSAGLTFAKENDASTNIIVDVDTGTQTYYFNVVGIVSTTMNWTGLITETITSP